jgi:hypothetical protein
LKVFPPVGAKQPPQGVKSDTKVLNRGFAFFIKREFGGVGPMHKCCSKCPMFDECGHRDGCCPECDFYSDGECLFGGEEPYEDLIDEERS